MRRTVMLAVLAAEISGTHVQTAERPNVILILSDDHRWDGIGASGNSNVVTPNLDRLARTGVYFPQAVAHVPQCSPNRATLLTGLPPHQTGWFSNQSQRKEIVGPDGLGRYPLLPKLLQDAGYDTAFVGKWHLVQEPWLSGFSDVRTWLPGGSGPYRNLPVARGRSRGLAPANGFTQEVFADDAIEYVNAAAGRQRPFFLWLALTAPHGPFQPNPERIQKLYAGRSPESLLPPGFDRSARMDNWTNYYEAITSVDEQVGRLLQALEDRKLVQNTIVIFMGDNGFMMGSRGWTGKVIPYEESVRVPLIIRAPMLAKFEGRTDAVPSSLDLPASIARWAGAKVPGNWTGRDVTAALESKRDHKLPHAIVEFADNQSQQFGQYAYRAIRTPTAKLILWETPAKKDELYDLLKDPRETANLIDDPSHERTRAELRGQLDAWMKRTADTFRKSGDKASSR
jgi:arylsulfatase A-like enzyme